MLLRLLVRDFVIVDRLELEFGGGFGALTGPSRGRQRATRLKIGPVQERHLRLPMVEAQQAT